MIPSTSLKVCCIQDERELAMARRVGAAFAGLVGEMPSGPGPIADEHIARVAAGAPEGITPVLLTARSEAERIAEHVRVAGVRAVQIVRRVAPIVRGELRAAVQGVTVLQVVHVEDPSCLDEALEAAVGSDYLLLDSGRPSAVIAELGGTGRVHDWSLSAAVVHASPVPVFLAGGLRPENVAEAIREVRPWGVDVCSGLRDGAGRLLPERLEAFALAVSAVQP